MLLESKSRGLERIFVHGLRQVQGESLPNLRLNNATMSRMLERGREGVF